MKIVFNTCFGGYGLSENFLNAYPRFNEGTDRDDQDFIKALEDFGLEEASDDCGELTIIDLPENTTDWYIEEYDGLETIIYVVDGKLCFSD